MTITPEQCHSARGLLGWTIQKLAVKSRLISTSVTNFEKGNLPADVSVAKMRQALEVLIPGEAAHHNEMMPPAVTE
jgi:ribosome-binding protein aMBF1 (putative translation factor)